ncbi:hypothetical protein AGMMS49592_0410 [Endomicrobiia bacterium]|nr:hypothetical protein AGMMS49592_0410 [Endomicrobiia bacterium]
MKSKYSKKEIKLEDRLEFKLTIKQQEALKLAQKSDFFLTYGGSQSSKSFFWAYYIISRALIAPGSNHIIARKTLHSIMTIFFPQTFLVVLQKAFPDLRYEFNAKYYFVYFPDFKSTIHFVGVEDAVALKNKYGGYYSTVFCDELEQFEFHEFQMLSGTRLSEKSGLRTVAGGALNPTDMDTWHYKFFVLHTHPILNIPFSKIKEHVLENTKLDEATRKNIEENYKEKVINSIQMNPIDNISNLSSTYISSLASMDDRNRERFLLGNYTNVYAVGAIYERELTKCDIDKRIYDMETLDKTLKIHVVFDIGYKDPTAMWFCQFSKDKIIFYDYYENNILSDTHYIQLMLERYPGEIAHVWLPHDAATIRWDKSSPYQKMYEIGLRHNFQVSALTRDFRVIHSINKARDLFYKCHFNSKLCSQGIDNLKKYKYKSEAENEFQKVPEHSKYSHGADAFRYACRAYAQLFNADLFENLTTADEYDEDNDCYMHGAKKFFNGREIASEYETTTSTGCVVRHIKFKDEEDLHKKYIKYM